MFVIINKYISQLKTLPLQCTQNTKKKRKRKSNANNHEEIYSILILINIQTVNVLYIVIFLVEHFEHEFLAWETGGPLLMLPTVCIVLIVCIKAAK